MYGLHFCYDFIGGLCQYRFRNFTYADPFSPRATLLKNMDKPITKNTLENHTMAAIKQKQNRLIDLVTYIVVNIYLSIRVR